MSYQSKYTGLEIDELLDKVNNSRESDYTETELLNSQISYNLTSNTSVSINEDITLAQAITDFDEIVFAVALTDESGTFSNCNWLKLLTSNVVYNNSDSMVWDGSRFSLCTLPTSGVPEVCGVWFKTPSIIKIWNTFTKNPSLYNGSKIVIRSIKGIKYNVSSIENTKEYGEFLIDQTTGTTITKLAVNKVQGNMNVNENNNILLTPGKNYLLIVNVKQIQYTESEGTCYHSLYFANDLSNRLSAIEFSPEGSTTTYAKTRTLPRAWITTLKATEANNELAIYNSAFADRVPSINLSKIVDNIIVVEINDSSYSGDSTPVGNIISFMGTKAPKGYLICDGTELNVADYPRLATHFETQFGSKNYFGGDGTTTFAVPDLRNEFLRGYGELSNEIGIHQDATNLPNIYTANNGKGLLVPLYNASSGTTSQANNVDSQKNEADYGTDSSKYQISQFNGSLITDSNYGSVMQSYTARPTNVAVLYCIKY